jgi:nitroimidazol reductase NimA-like FMN-containing flavoprotein (pyridoxamine 5'-phosphate oxidase superfamily)
MERAAIEDIIRRALVCRLGLSDGGRPYVVPLTFGYRDNALYFHGGTHGTKARILKANNRVCFEFDVDVEIAPSDQPCKWGLKYRSVIGHGTVGFVEDRAAKREALSIITAHYAPGAYEFADAAVDSVTIIRVDIESMTGKQAGY